MDEREKEILMERAAEVLKANPAAVSWMERDVRVMSLWQPWASLCIWRNPEDGQAEKQIETRSWPHTYRGLIAIHATRTFPAYVKRECQENPFIRSALFRHGLSPSGGGLVCGGILGTVELVDVLHTTELRKVIGRAFPLREKAFGNYSPGRFGFVFKNPREFVEPLAFKSRQGQLLSIDPETQKEILSREVRK